MLRRLFLRRGARTPLVDGNRAELLVDGARYFDALERAIAEAQRYVFMETYILRADRTGWRVARALSAARHRGCEVALSYDGYGSLGLSEELTSFLRLAGVKLLEYRPVRFSRAHAPWTRRDHRKLTVIDGRVGFTGGHNLADDYAAPRDGGKNWRDTSCRIDGPAVAQLEELFRRNWKRHAKLALASPSPPPAAPEGQAKVRFVGNFGRLERADIRRDYISAILAARRSVRITNAYFAPDRGLVRALCRAAKRGVAVELILAAKSDVRPMVLVARGFYAPLFRAGVRIFEWHERVLHAKTAVVDGEWSSIGSANLNQRSLRYDLEANATIVSALLGEEMDRVFADDRARSREVVVAEWARRPWWMRLIERFFALFRGIA